VSKITLNTDTLNALWQKERKPFNRSEAYVWLCCNSVNNEIEFGQQSLADTFRWTRQQVRDFVDFLIENNLAKHIKRTSETTNERTSKRTILSITEPISYKGKPPVKEPKKEPVKQPVKKREYTDKELESFAKFNQWILTHASQVSKMAEPFNIDQYLDITHTCSKEQILETLTNMHNHKPLLKKYVNAYRTFLNWSKPKP